MHIVVAGAGRMGAHHAHTFASLAGVARVTIVDIDAACAQAVATDVAEALATEAFITNADDIAEVFAAEGNNVHVDGVVIAAATPAHAPLIIAAARAGIPTLCEKPIALDRVETERALAVVAEAGTYLQIGFQRRFDQGFVAVRDAIANGSLGDVHLIRLGTLDPAPPPLHYLRVSGGVFRDMHIHDFDSVRFVTGDEVVDVTTVGAVTVDLAIGELGDVDTTAMVLTMSSGALVVVSGCRQNPRGYDVRLEAFGSRDAITVGLGERTPMRSVEPDGLLAEHRGENGWEFFIDRFADAYRAQAQAFVASVAAGATGTSDNPCSGEDGRTALLLAIAAERSRTTGQRVALKAIVAEVAQ